MVKLEDVQVLGKENLDTVMKSLGVYSQGFQAIAAAFTDYSKKSAEEGTAFIEKLAGVKSLDKAIEVQTDFAKSSYESFVAEATKIGELYQNLAKEALKPLEGLTSKFGLKQ